MGILPDPCAPVPPACVNSPASVPAFPTRPDQMPGATVAELLDAYQRHLYAVVRQRSGGAEPAGLIARHVVAALALGQAIVDTFAEERWPLVRDGLAAGATTADLGGALGGLDVTAVTAGLTSWAECERRAGVLSVDDYHAVLALVGGAQ
jgi:hypothetical protein